MVESCCQPWPEMSAQSPMPVTAKETMVHGPKRFGKSDVDPVNSHLIVHEHSYPILEYTKAEEIGHKDTGGLWSCL